ncbi:hypothetical protein BC830DRAFT_1143259, partial [Chytriomyces sp. MP71]
AASLLLSSKDAPFTPAFAFPISAITSITRTRTLPMLVAPNAIQIECRNISDDIFAAHSFKHAFTNFVGVKVSAIETFINQAIDADRVKQARSVFGDRSKSKSKNVARRLSIGTQNLYNMFTGNKGQLASDTDTSAATVINSSGGRGSMDSAAEASSSTEPIPSIILSKTSYEALSGTSKAPGALAQILLAKSDNPDRPDSAGSDSSTFSERSAGIPIQRAASIRVVSVASSLEADQISTLKRTAHPVLPLPLHGASSLRQSAESSASLQTPKTPSILKMRSNPVLSPTGLESPADQRDHVLSAAIRLRQKKQQEQRQAEQVNARDSDDIPAPPRASSRNSEYVDDHDDDLLEWKLNAMEGLTVDYERLVDVVLVGFASVVMLIVVVDSYLLIKLIF